MEGENELLVEVTRVGRLEISRLKCLVEDRSIENKSIQGIEVRLTNKKPNSH